MPYIIQHSKSKRCRLLDNYDGKRVTIMPNLGTKKHLADMAKGKYMEAVREGLNVRPGLTYSFVLEYLQAKKEGRNLEMAGRRFPIEEMADTYLRLHGPTLKGGADMSYTSPYYGQFLRMRQIKKAWAGKCAHEIGRYDIRDLLSGYKSPGTKVRWLGMLGHMFSFFENLNDEEPETIQGPVRLPKHNPAKKWRRLMKPHEKQEDPRERVLTPEEWSKLYAYSSPMMKKILGLALITCLRLKDLRQLNGREVVGGMVTLTMAKTMKPITVSIPGMSGKIHLDFTNFTSLFKDTLKRAGMAFPPGDDRHLAFRDLRRTGATWYYRKDKDRAKVQALLGHKKSTTTDRYIHLTEANLKDVGETMSLLAAPQPFVVDPKALIGPKTRRGKRRSTGVAKVRTKKKDVHLMDTLDHREGE